MRPKLSIDYRRDRSLLNAKHLSDFALKIIARFIQCTNLEYIVFGKFGCASCFASFMKSTQYIIAVPYIFARRHPLKVISLIVRLVSILVVNLMTGGWTQAMKCLAYEYVDWHSPNLSIPAQANCFVAAPIASSKDVSDMTISRFADTHYIAKTTSLVDAFVAGYIAPLFKGELESVKLWGMILHVASPFVTIGQSRGRHQRRSAISIGCYSCNYSIFGPNAKDGRRLPRPT
jgi:hypothetical protein